MAILPVKKSGATYSSLALAYAAASASDIIEIQDSEEYNEQLNIAINDLTIRSAEGCSPTLWSATYFISLDAALTSFQILGTSENKLNLKTTGTNADLIKINGNTSVNAQYVNVITNATQRIFRALTNNSSLVSLSDSTIVCASIFYSGNFTNLFLSGVSGSCQYILSGAKTFSGIIIKNQLTISISINTSGSIAFGSGLLFANNYFIATNETALEFFYTGVLGFNFENNTIICTATAKNLDCFSFSNFIPTGTELLNNIISGFDNAISHVNQAGPCGDYNCLFFNVDDYAGLATAGAHDITSDPELTGYILSATSPCIDAGTSSVAYADDLLNTVRPQGPNYDIGCYEVPIFGIVYAYQDTTQSIIVKFHDDMTMVSDEGVNDALNIDNYVLSGTIYDGTILAVEEFDTDAVKLFLSKRIVDKSKYVLITDNLQTSTGRPIDPEYTDVYGTYAPANPTAFEKQFPRDIVGNKFDEDTEEYDPESKITDTDGDLKLLSAKDTIKKIIHNVCLTQLGSLVYTSTFGTDFELKGLITTSTLIKIKTSVENSLRTINYVTDFSVSVVHNFDKINVYIKAKTNLGTVNVDLSGVTLV